MLRLAVLRFAVLRFAVERFAVGPRFAVLRLAVLRFAVERFAGSASPSQRFARAALRRANASPSVGPLRRRALRGAALRGAALRGQRFAVLRFAVLRFAVLRLAVLRFAVERFAVLRLAVDASRSSAWLDVERLDDRGRRVAAGIAGADASGRLSSSSLEPLPARSMYDCSSLGVS